MLTIPQTAGTAFLTFTRTGSETVLTRAFATSPAKLIETKRRGATCWVYTANLGGGLVGGDDIRLHADVGPGARALVTTQASTKVYRSQRRSTQVLDATVGAQALLAVIPDPVVCFRDADFAQTQRYDLDADASLVMVDWITSGRHAAGERWAFSRYESRFDIRRGSRRIFWDALVLETNIDTVFERMGRFDVLLTAVITGPLVAGAATAIAHGLSETPIEHPARQGFPAGVCDLVVSAATLGDGGTLLRMAGTSVERMGQALGSYLSFLSPLVGDDPWSRKW
jgi:urease accessory protein